MTTSDDTLSPHLPTETVSAYLDRALSESEAAAVEEHLAHCAACRTDLAEVGALLRKRRRRRRLHSYGGTANQSFIVSGQYNDGSTLNYDGHNAYDFVTTDQDPNGNVRVLAPMDGVVVCSFDGEVPSQCEVGELRIDHGNGYVTRSLHLDRTMVKFGDTVRGGQFIAVAGSRGLNIHGRLPTQGRQPGPEPHLHFEVLRHVDLWNPQSPLIEVDPYGWRGLLADPWARHSGIRNVPLW